ncbi:Zinc finger protein Noc [Armadillidium nasatum]|uniref:Zinc finger protein Noc n=1 Tax=Armadillidium nasatum TaxID=96803 RepID=A0A5N5T6Z4_9CRUS|nr:Zinc finger protein Noc [Armadillidium nasatum]
MLTSSANHYLRPEYLSPIQGNNIEKPPSTPLGDKNKGKSTPGEKSPSIGHEDSKSTSSFKPYEKKGSDDGEGRGSPLKRSPLGGSKSPSSNSNPVRSSSRSSDDGKSPLNVHDIPSSSSIVSSSVVSIRNSLSPSLSSKTSSVTPSHSLASLGDLSKDPLAAYKLAPGLYSPLGLGLDPLGAAGLSALTAKVPTSSASASLSSPFIGYARVKTANGNEVIIPVCRDPYCTGCQINTHALQVVNGTCPPGCSQCAQVAAHTKTLSSLPSSLISSIPSSSLASLYPTTALVSSSTTHHPYVCNWIAGDTYCGKRFPTSEELLQHLRTHTNLTSTESSTIPLHLLHHHPLLSPHPSLPRSYPTPPLSPISASRYHPYAKSTIPHLSAASPLSSAAAASALSVASLSALTPHPLSAYYSPYSFYARGLGATVGLHP